MPTFGPGGCCVVAQGTRLMRKGHASCTAGTPHAQRTRLICPVCGQCYPRPSGSRHAARLTSLCTLPGMRVHCPRKLHHCACFVTPLAPVAWCCPAGDGSDSSAPIFDLPPSPPPPPTDPALPAVQIQPPPPDAPQQANQVGTGSAASLPHLALRPAIRQVPLFLRSSTPQVTVAMTWCRATAARHAHADPPPFCILRRSCRSLSP
jgi:hypothetical protein